MTRRGFLLTPAVLPCSPGLIFEAQQSALEHQIFQAINFQREAASAPPLTWDPRLRNTARAHSSRMLALQFFGHQDPERGSLGTRLTVAGIGYLRCAENVLREQGSIFPVASAVISWMYSDGHRQNLLTPEFTHSAVGVATGSNETIFVTQQFLLPAPLFDHLRPHGSKCARVDNETLAKIPVRI